MIKDIWTESFLRDLSDEDILTFQEIVLQDVKGKTTSSDSKTILGNNLDLWLYCLQILRKEIELQLSQHKNGAGIKVQEMRFNGDSKDAIDEVILLEKKWRNNAMKFLTSVEKRMLYVKLLLQEEDSTEE